MKRRAFTIIELLVAAGVLAMLVAATLPRFVAYSRQQDFGANSQLLVQCLRQAESSAANQPLSATSRYVSATITSNGSTVGCSTQYVSNYDVLSGAPIGSALLAKAGSTASLASAISSYTVPSATINSITAVNGDLTPAGAFGVDGSAGRSSLRIYFDSAAAGAPTVICGSISPTYTSCPAAALFSDRGLKIVLALKGSEDDSLGGTVTISPIGGAITYE